MRLRLKIIHGAQFVQPDDIERAEQAALASLKAETTRGDMELAESAANLALTEGWHDPNSAFCEIIAR